MVAGFVACGPNEALVVSGCCHSHPLMVPGGRVFVWPVIQRVQRISLNTMTLTIESPKVYTQQGVPISVTGIAQVKIQGQNVEMLRAACEQFLGKKEDEIMQIARETLEGHQRAIMGTMTVEEIYKDRKKFSKQVFEVASSDLVNMGITVVSYTIKDISDEEGYLRALGQARTAEVKRDARIGEAEARRDAQIKEALAEEERMAARLLNDTEIAKAQRDFENKKALYDQEVNTKKAESDLAYSLQAAKTRQKIKEEQMQVKVVERTQAIQVQEQEILRKEKELVAMVRRPAEAEKYRLERLAEANKNRIVMEAEADSEAIRLKGEAEAFAIEAKAKAEAEQLAKKADAFREYKDAAILDMMLDTLPKIAAEVAAPISQCRKLTMVSSGNGEVGAGKLTGEIIDIITKTTSMVHQLTGVNIGAGSGSGPTAMRRTPSASSGGTPGGASWGCCCDHTASSSHHHDHSQQQKQDVCVLRRKAQQEEQCCQSPCLHCLHQSRPCCCCCYALLCFLSKCCCPSSPISARLVNASTQTELVFDKFNNCDSSDRKNHAECTNVAAKYAKLLKDLRFAVAVHRDHAVRLLFFAVEQLVMDLSLLGNVNRATTNCGESVDKKAPYKFNTPRKAKFFHPGSNLIEMKNWRSFDAIPGVKSELVKLKRSNSVMLNCDMINGEKASFGTVRDSPSILLTTENSFKKITDHRRKPKLDKHFRPSTRLESGQILFVFILLFLICFWRFLQAA